MKTNKLLDNRKRSRSDKETMRISAVVRVQEGESPEDVALALDINRRTIYRWLEQYHYGGIEALKSKPILGAPSKLDAKQMQRLVKIIREKTPQQLRFEYALWTLSIIRGVIKKEFNVSLSEVSVGRLVRRLGFTPQRPLYKAWQQNADVVERWQKEEYPKIAKRAKKEGAMIFFADESGIRTDHHAGTTWAPKGQTPIVKATGARQGINMISAVNALGHFRFKLVDGSVTSSVFLDFIQSLIVGVDQKIFLIVDGHPTHKSKMLKAFLQDHQDKIELFYLPPYSPELNPDELAWAHVKNSVRKQVAQNKEELVDLVKAALFSLQKLPSIVKGFFNAPSCRYAIQ